MSRKRKPGRRVNATGRSVGKEQYVNLPYAMFKSVAWRSLKGSALKVHFELGLRFHGGNNGKLIFSLEEGARALSPGKATVQAALKGSGSKRLRRLH